MQTILYVSLIFIASTCTICFSDRVQEKKYTSLKFELNNGVIRVANKASQLITGMNQTSFENQHGLVLLSLSGSYLAVQGSKSNHNRIVAALKWREWWSKLEFTYFTDNNVMITSWNNAVVTNNITGKALGSSIPINAYDQRTQNFNFSISRNSKLAASASIFCKVTALKNRDVIVQLGHDVIYMREQMFTFHTPQYITHHNISRAYSGWRLDRIITLRDKISGTSTVVLIESIYNEKIPILSLQFDDKLRLTAYNGSSGGIIVSNSSSYITTFGIDQNSSWKQGRFHGSTSDFIHQSEMVGRFSGTSCLAARFPDNDDETLLTFPRSLLLLLKKPRFVFIDYPYFLDVGASYIELFDMNTRESVRIKKRETHCDKIKISISYDMKVDAICWEWEDTSLPEPLRFGLQYLNNAEEKRAITKLTTKTGARNEVLLSLEYTDVKTRVKIGANELSIEQGKVELSDVRFNFTESRSELRYFDKEKNREIIFSPKLEDNKSEKIGICIGENSMAMYYPGGKTSMNYNSQLAKKQRVDKSDWDVQVRNRSLVDSKRKVTRAPPRKGKKSV